MLDFTDVALKILFAGLILYPAFAFGLLPADLQKKAFRVLQERNLLVSIDGPSLQKKQKVLFVRYQPELDEYEIIAQGSVERSNQTISVVELNSDVLKKIPVRGDFAVLLAEPKQFEAKTSPAPPSDLSLQQEKPPLPEAGYFDLGLINQSGRLEGESGNQANSYKDINSYQMKGFQFTWFLEFLPQYGISLQNSSSLVPVVSYYLRTYPSTFDRSSFRLLFRTRRSDHHLRWTFFLENLSEKFTTGNSDEYILSSEYAFLGTGLNLAWEPRDTFHNPSRFWGSPQRLYFETGYFPIVNARDLGVSRGTSSSGSLRTELTVGYTHILRWDFVPWFKRFYVDLRHVVTDLKLSFQGNTTSEAGNLYYIVPQGGMYREQNRYFQVTFGIRMEDLVGRTFKPRD